MYNWRYQGSRHVFHFKGTIHHLRSVSVDCLVNMPVFAVLGISQSPSLKGEYAEKILISAFLARVMHGKQLGKLSQSLINPSTPAQAVWCYRQVRIYTV